MSGLDDMIAKLPGTRRAIALARLTDVIAKLPETRRAAVLARLAHVISEEVLIARFTSHIEEQTARAFNESHGSAIQPSASAAMARPSAPEKPMQKPSSTAAT